MTDLNRDPLAQLLGMCGSQFDGEALNGARAADKLIRAAGMTWLDLLTPYDELQRANDAARALLAENKGLREELDQYHDGDGRDAWHNIPTARLGDGDPRVRARWALGLSAAATCASISAAFLPLSANGAGR